MVANKIAPVHISDTGKRVMSTSLKLKKPLPNEQKGAYIILTCNENFKIESESLRNEKSTN